MQIDDVRLRARIGLVIPSVNTMTEPQFNRFAPEGIGVHVARVRISDSDGRMLPSSTLMPDVVRAAELLADARCDLIVFHCTASSMEAGLDGERRITEAIQTATGVTASTTASAIVAAFQALHIRRVVLVSPYPASTNEHEIHFLSQVGVQVLRDRPLDLPPAQWTIKPGGFWVDAGAAEDDAEADAIFLSCTNIRAIDAVDPLEARTGKPVITSNQATLWHCLRTLGLPDEVGGLGRLFGVGLPVAAGA